MRNFLELSICACLAVAGGSQPLAAQPAPANSKPEFEAASVKTSQPDEPHAKVMRHMWEMMPPGTLPMPNPGRLHIEGWSLRHTIAAANRMRDENVSGPSWLDDQHFDIEAKLPEGAKRDDAHEMLQSLLGERFGLEVHRESHQQAGFTLAVGKNGPKLEEFVAPAPPPAPAEPLTPEETQERQKQQAEERMKAVQAQLQQQVRSGAHKPGSSWASWKGITTTQFAERLSSRAGGPVVDETGLNGKYNFAIETWPATDDDPGQTIFEAIEKLGLRLAPRKTSVELLVIDKVSKTPAAN